MELRHTKAELVTEIAAAWTKLHTALDRLTEPQMTEIRDAHGWTVKDHLVHLAAWERSVAVFLQSKPRHAGLQVDEQLYLSGDEDAINAVIQQQRQDVSLAEVLAELRTVHGQLLSAIAPLSEDDLYKANSDFQPDTSGERDERPVIEMIYGTTAHHFREHQQWIASLVAQAR